MSSQIDSFDVIQQLRKNDIIIHPMTEEKYVIGEIGNDFFLLNLFNENRALKMMRFHDLIREKWQIEKSLPESKSSPSISIRN
jgi:hypothetical protein